MNAVSAALEFELTATFTAGRPLRAAVGGAPPTKETIAAVQKMGITVTHLSDLGEQELTEFVRERLAHFKAPGQVYFEALPETSTGKIQKNVLRDRARDRAQPQ
jgi:fatty-acyl-CoA synthase